MFTSWSVLIFLTTCLVTASATPFGNSIGDDTPDGPTISPPQNEIVLQQGQNFTFKCKGKTMLRFKQQEVPEEITSHFNVQQRNISSDMSSSEFEVALDLYNVDKFAVGYYACYDSEVDDDEVLNDITEELINTQHIAYTYVYVNGSDSLFAPMRQLVVARSKSNFVIACRPTTPDIKINLTTTQPQSNKATDIVKFSPKIGFLMKARSKSAYTCEGQRGNTKATKSIMKSARWAPKPNVTGSLYFLEGETFTLNCTVLYQLNSAIALSWITPPALNKGFIKNYTNEHAVIDGILYYNLTIENAPKEAAGKYTCQSTKSNYHEKTDFKKKFLNESLLMLEKGIDKEPYELSARTVRLFYTLASYPPANYTIYRDGRPLRILPGDKKYEINKATDGSVVLRIVNATVADSGAYTVVATNGYKRKEATYNLRITGRPAIDFGSEAPRKYVIKTIATLLCEATGYPIPTITWLFNNDETNQTSEGNYEILSAYKAASTLSVPVQESGNIACIANNSLGTTSAARQFLVYDVPEGFGILNYGNTWFAKNQRVVFRCLASVYNFDNVTWLGEDGNELIGMVAFTEFSYSYVAELIIEQISLNQAGKYSCVGLKNSTILEQQTIDITVEDIRYPTLVESTNVIDNEAFVYQEVILNCIADAVPPPNVVWYKDGIILTNNTNVEILPEILNLTAVNSTVKIKRMQVDDKGEYKCVATSSESDEEKVFDLLIKENPTFNAKYIGIIGLVILVLIALVLYLTWRIRKEKQFRKQLAAAGLLYFKEGVPTAINPELDIYEQAELLPYDEKFEFPINNLKFGIQLGAGAFGVVHKAEARGIINAEQTTTVAVKMVHKTADNMYIKALATELKIMVHIGKHPNIVNLLGACTKNVGKRELYVIVEYCQYGNLHNYLQKHRLGFIDQLTDNVDNDRFGSINRGYSTSSGTHSDYCGHSQNTDHTFLNSANTNRSSSRKESDSNYVQPQWRSNYTYYSEGCTPRPLTSGDLLYWAFQIAKGMEYLASRRVLHGDLAARNILLADDNIVKICDFGLARSIYKNDEYLKKENSPLPVKWLAIECITDRIFSTQSDVWAFGIVLWELFTLAKTPYPNISPASLLEFLRSGSRLNKPQYANDLLYDVMLRCWKHKPTERPSFTELQRELETYVEQHQRDRYEGLSAHYVEMNTRNRGSEPDYLVQVCPPDYNHHVTPSPSDAHKRFNLTPADIPEYLQMSPPKNQSQFDFNASLLNRRESEGDNQACEKTPMLNMNNLTTISGSESDHERSSPLYHNFNDRIEEEADDVFEEKNNIKNINNSAVTNPTYIVYDTNAEKKPLNNPNHYINVKPNGLVK